MDLVAAARGGDVFRVRHELGQPLVRLLLRCARNIAALVTAGETDPNQLRNLRSSENCHL